MNHEPMRRDEGRVIFEAVDSTAGYAVLVVLLVLVGGSLLWWWPGSLTEYVAPWTRDEWGHLETLGYAMSLALVGGLLVVVGGYVSDRGRRQRLVFDANEAVCRVREWWRGIEVEVEIPLGRFEEFRVHRPVGRDDVWQLGLVLDNGSYWRMDRGEDGKALRQRAEQLNDEMEFGDREEGEVRLAQRVKMQRGDDGWTLRWTHHECTSTQVLMVVAAVVFSMAVIAPVLLVFEGNYTALAAAVGVAAVLFATPLFAPWSPRVSWPFWAGWFGVAVAAVGWLGAHWAYFPVATAGLAIFANSTASVLSDLFDPPEHSLVIDEAGRIYEDGESLEADGNLVVVDDVEGAISNVTEVRLPAVELVGEGGRAANRSRQLNEQLPQDVALGEPVELKLMGLSIFEQAVVGLVVDEKVSE